MGSSTEGVTTDMLAGVSRGYLHPGSLKASQTVLVNYHHGMEASSVWGQGRTSSSDGQRFGIQGNSMQASFYPRYFGYYDRAITVLTHVSDLCSVLGTQVISCGTREALYVLDALLKNDTDRGTVRPDGSRGGLLAQPHGPGECRGATSRGQQTLRSPGQGFPRVRPTDEDDLHSPIPSRTRATAAYSASAQSG